MNATADNHAADRTNREPLKPIACPVCLRVVRFLVKYYTANRKGQFVLRGSCCLECSKIYR